MWLSLVDGCNRRPGTENIAKLSGISAGLNANYWTHWIDIKPEFTDLDPTTGLPTTVDEAQRYLLLGSKPQDGGVKVMRAFDLDGTELHIEDRVGAVASGTLAAVKPSWESAYFAGLSTSARELLQLITIADTTIIVNRSVTCAMDSAVKTTAPADGLGYFFVRMGAYLTDYICNVKYDSSATPITPSFGETVQTWPGSWQAAAGWISGQLNDISTEAIASQLATDLTANGSRPATMTISAVGSLVRVAGGATAGHDLVALYGSDGAGNSAMETLFEQVDVTVDLPLYGIDDGFKLKVIGDPAIGGDDYYIEFIQDDLGISTGTMVGEGHWEQTVAHGTEYMLDADTMPHKLTRKVGTGAALPSGYSPANGEIYFDYEQITWGERETGDSTINPDPSFVGRKIQEVFLYKNRLGFLSDDKVIMSETNNFFNFFRTDMIQVLDTDPIDVANGHTEASFTQRAIPFESDLVLFSERDQFRFPGDEVLTPKTIGIRHISGFRNDPQVKPVRTATGVLFAQKNGNSTQILELYRRGNSGLFDAAELSEQCRRYIDGAVRELTVATDASVACAIIDSPLAFNQSDIYVYQWHWSGRDRVQSAWHKWDLQDAACYSAHFFDDLLYMLVFRANGTYIERLDVREGGTDAYPDDAPTRDMDFRVRLDRKYVVASGDPNVSFGGGNSTVTLEYDLSPTEFPLAMYFSDQGGGNANKVLIPDEVSRVTPGSMAMTFYSVDLTTSDFWVGIPFLSEYELPSILLKERNSSGRGENVIAKGPSQVIEGTIVFDNSGPFFVEVTPAGQTAYNYWWNGGQLWTATNPTVPDVGVDAPDATLGSGEFDFPVWAEARDVTIKIRSVHPYPCPIQKMEFYLNHYHTGRRVR
jgi:hypothetical protein